MNVRHTAHQRPLTCRPRTRHSLRAAASSTQADEVRSAVEKATGSSVTAVSPLGGSSWSSAYRYDVSDGRRVFVKLGRGLGAQAMFDGEAQGLRALSATHTLRVPAVLHAGPVADGAMIAMEYFDLQGRVDQARLGGLLAEMHQAVPAYGRAAAGYFGFDCNNTIGGTLQVNTWSQETGVNGWVAFYRDNRLAPQLKLTRDTGIQRLGDKLMTHHLDALFCDLDDIQPSLIHGDLWSGNIHSVDGTPCILDPACYYGHAEAEWGMSWCAGFTAEMFEAYHALVPRGTLEAHSRPRARSPQFGQRAKLYQLYHYLTHLTLFGDGYRSSCMGLLESLTR